MIFSLFRRIKRSYKQVYRFVIMNNATFEEKVVLRLTPRLIFILFTALIVLLITLTISLIAFTPLREYIPSYGNEQSNHKITLLQTKADSIGKLIAEITTYGEDIKTVLTDGRFKDDTIDLNQKADVPVAKGEFAFSEYDSVLMQIEGRKTDKRLKNIPAYIKQKDRTPPPDLFFAPVDGGIIMQKYNPGSRGITIARTKENSVFASLAGRVIYSDYNLNTGTCIIILHPGNIITIYQQAGKSRVEVGDYVKPKQIISTLNSDDPMMFELWINGSFVNPEEYILF